MFCFQNALKLTYVNLGCQNFFQGLPPMGGRGGEGGTEGRRKGKEWRSCTSKFTSTPLPMTVNVKLIGLNSAVNLFMSKYCCL